MEYIQLKTVVSRKTKSRGRTAFTLVELLVVIGIIALLIGILLPSLSAAREASKRAVCAAKLQQIMVAATIHVNEHQGYYPLAGQLNYPDANGSIQNVGTGNLSGLNDPDVKHYTYMGVNNGGTTVVRFLAPITFALGTEMGQKRNLDATTDSVQLTADQDSTGVIRNFLCPSQAAQTNELIQLGWLFGGNDPDVGGLTGYTEQQSYIFNEYVLGYEDSLGRLRGQATRVKQSAKTMFACDGLGGSTITRAFAAVPFGGGGGVNIPGPWPFFTMYNNANYSPITMSDALTGKTGGTGNHRLAGDPANFDQVRHRGKMNVAFCDGHVELRDIPAFTIVGNNAVLKYDPTAKGLQNIYIVPN